jgi:Protein of unknown function (DUF3800)
MTQQLVEIACDESGAEGEKLLDGNTDVFAHASVQLSTAQADDCVRHLRDMIRSPAVEYKANHLLRAKNRPALLWLLAASGPLRGRARVQLTDKAFLLVTSLASLIGADGAQALTLYRDGPDAVGRRRWHQFLVCFNDLARANGREPASTAADTFFRTAEELGHASTSRRVRDILQRLQRSRPELEVFFGERARSSLSSVPPLDPLFPAIIEAVVSWSAGSRIVSVVHDRQTTLTPERIAQIGRLCGTLPGHPRLARLAGLRLADSASDKRIQVADFLAGVARKIASEELAHSGDPELAALLRPYVEASSVWADDRSWRLLAPPA